MADIEIELRPDVIKRLEAEAESKVPAVSRDLNFDTIVVVDNIPAVPEEKVDKLKSVLLNRFFSKIGALSEEKFILPLNAEKGTLGYGFVEFSTPEEAEKAIKSLNGYVLDRRHTFVVSLFSDFEKYADVPEEYVPPNPKERDEEENVYSWLFDNNYFKGFDQYLTRHGQDYELYWNNPKSKGKPIPCFGRQNVNFLRPDMYVNFSPLGSYLATFHAQGIALWGGNQFGLVQRIPHAKANGLDFSPDEKYLVTSTPYSPGSDVPASSKLLVFWEVRTGRRCRDFPGVTGNAWPVFHWSPDGKYFAFLGKDVISVYDTSTFGLLGKESIRMKGVKLFQWSPSDNIIATFVPQIDNSPARVVLIDIPSKTEIRQKNLFNVSDACKMHWQKNGEYLCVKVDRYHKKQKTTTANIASFELFRIKEKEIPIELLELKERVIAFAWEPNSARFAIIHTNNPTSIVNRNSISFYEMGDKKLTFLKKLENRCANSLFWSPQGDFIIFAMLQSGGASNGTLEFFSVNEMETIGADEHFSCTGIDWDNTGRFVASTASFWRSQVETGYNLYTFQGDLVCRVLKDRFYQFIWRPRPKTLLSPEEIEKIRVDLRTYSEQYRQEEKQDYELIKSKYRAQREKQRTDFEEWYAKRLEEYVSMKEERARIRGCESDTEDDYVLVEQIVEEVLSVEEIPEDSN